MELKQSGTVFVNHGLWYYSVKLPGERKRRQVPLCAPGSMRTLHADRPRKMAEEAAARYWEGHVRQDVRNTPSGFTVSELCARYDAHCREYYRDAGGNRTSTATNARIDTRLFRELYGKAYVSELTHADMLQFRDALVRSGLYRKTVNGRILRVKQMFEWALDEALIPAVVKAELTQVKYIKRGRTPAPERRPVTVVTDSTVEATLAHLMPNTADMVRLHRVTGMRPCELCALRWSAIDTSRTPWVYRVPQSANKNAWRGEYGVPRVVCIGPKGRAILERHRGGGDVPFSPKLAMAEHLAALHAARVTPVYGKRKRPPDRPPRVLGDAWVSHAYGRTIREACHRGGIPPWGPNRLRHTFATEVRRKFGLAATKAVLGHNSERCVTDIYTYDAIEDEMIRTAAPAVEALG